MHILLLLLLLAPPLASAELPAYRRHSDHALPLVAVVGASPMTELIDYLVPFAVLSESRLAEVRALSVDPGPLQLMPALQIEPQASIADFDRKHPEGADYLVVPAVHDPAEPRLIAWIQAQAAKGAVLIGICDGALVLAEAGLLDGRRATGHWYSRARRESDYPQVHWQEDLRYVVDGPVLTSAGVSAALPASLALVETLGGRDQAALLARRLGVTDWSARHQSTSFAFGPADYLQAGVGWVDGLWPERLELAVASGADELALALAVDAQARTWRSEVQVTAAAPVISRHGLRLYTQTPVANAQRLPPLPKLAADALPLALKSIEQRHGLGARRFVALQLEYPDPRSLAIPHP